MSLQAWQGAGELATVQGDAEQVFVRRCFGLPLSRSVLACKGKFGSPSRESAGETGIVVVREHQDQSGHMT